MKKYYTKNKKDEWVWVTREKAIELVNSGKKQKSDFKIVDEPSTREAVPFKITDDEIVPQSKSERAYEDMQKKIDIEREQQQVKDMYGWMTENPIMDFVAPMVAPASMETIHEGKMPSGVDLGIDAGLNIASRFIPVPGGAGALRTIGKNALIGAGIGAGTEGVLQAAHDDEFDISDIALGGLLGTVGGAGAGALKNLSNKRLADIIPDEKSRDYIEKNLGSTQAKTIKNLYKEAPKALKDLGETQIPVKTDGKMFGGVVTTADIPYTKIDDLNKKVLGDIKKKRVSGDMDFETAEQKRKILDEFNKSIIDIAGSNYSEGVPFKTMLTEAERLYAKDPEIGTAFIKILQPTIENQRMGAVQIASLYGDVPVPENAEERITKSISDKIKKMQLANLYAEKAPKATSVEFGGDYGKYALDAAKTATPERIAGAAKSARTTAVRVTPRAGKVPVVENDENKYDEEGNLVYAPQGQRGYDWLWEEAEKVKSKAKKLKDLYGD